MSGIGATATVTGDRRAQRRAATRGEIVEAAWAVAREEGLAGLTMRDLGARVGMKAQSLYSYVASKHEIYDAMFEQGYRELADWMSAGGAATDARSDAHRFFAFCVSDPVRFQLLFLRTLPGFEPSPSSYALAVDVLETMTARLATVGVRKARHVDLWTAVMTGLASQQIANDPGGARWERIVDDAVDMLLAHTGSPQRSRPTTGRSPR
ncbi:MAG: TetR/AcrR family transcriptional regulator [Ilumatobacteraceae bacterium]|jgi:AcrR family transcriptional regulator|nr:TetR/AcrR family transcriptional regulator [Ilumatobacteraceae bacterium]